MLFRHQLALGASLVVGVLWFMLLDALHVEWSVNEQYSFGWWVPLLVALLFHQRWRVRPLPESPHSGFRFWLVVVALALTLLPTRLIQEANPAWRLNVWLLAFDAIGLTLAMLYALGGRAWLRHFAFPVAFFLVAVPWPTFVEAPVVQGLMRANTAVTVEVLHWLGVPALQRGNLIEVSAGVVGIEEACSGIRSFQASLMLALCFGELKRLPFLSRIGLLGAGWGLAMVLNLGRTLLLISVALRDGIAAMGRWHDGLGLLVVAAIFGVLWWAGQWLAERDPPPADAALDSTPALEVSRPTAWFVGCVALAAWILAVEVGVECWYRAHERELGAPVTWGVAVPHGRADFAELPISEATRQILRFDDGVNVRWQDPDGTRWQLIFLRWDPGRVGVQLAKNHTPEICLTASGRNVVAASPPQFMEVAGLRLPFRSYTVADRGSTAHVFYCLWEDFHPGQSFDSASLNFRSRLAAVAQGRRNLGQRSLEIIVWGEPSASAARAAVQRFLEAAIRKEAGA